MSYTFPTSGKYVVSFRFQNNEEPLIEDSYPITVLPASEGGFTIFGIVILPYLYALAGLSAGIIISLAPGMVRARKGRVRA